MNIEVEPTRVVIRLNTEPKEVITTPNSGVFTRALFYEALKVVNPKFGKFLHDAPTKKPFSITGLRSKDRRFDSGLLILKSPIYFILSSVYFDIVNMFLDGLEKFDVIKFPGFTAQISKIKINPLKDVNYIKTKTPAIFRAKNKKHYFELGETMFFNAVDFSIKIVEMYNGSIEDYTIDFVKKKMVHYDEKSIPGHLIGIKIRGDTGILRALGLGNSTTRGFGILS